MLFPRESSSNSKWTIEYNYLEKVKYLSELNNSGYSLALEEIEGILLVCEHLFNLNNKGGQVKIKLTAAIIRSLINALKKRRTAIPLDDVTEETTIEVAEEMLNTIEKSIKGGEWYE